MSTPFYEIHVYNSVAERTGNQVDRSAVRGRVGVCRSITDLGAKSRRLGDGYYYLASGAWPEEVSSVDLSRPWAPLG